MNRILEFHVELHDSSLASITRVGRDLVIGLAPAYVHRAEGRPGIDHRTGWLQDLDLIIFGAVLDASPSELPIDLADGSLTVGEVTWDNLLPLPLAVLAEVSLNATTGCGELLAVRGLGASFLARGTPRYLDETPFLV